MFWADKLLEGRIGDEHINDAWTPSGMVHMGSMKGPVMHDVLFRMLKEQGTKVKFTYGFDDADPLDGLPLELMKTHEKYLGVPIHIAPSPDGNGSFADFFGRKLKKILDDIGIKPEIHRTSEEYKNGTYDKAIKFVLDHASEIRKVYEEIYDKKLSDDWFPLQVICPNCGKLGTTKVIGWDGEQAEFICKPDLVVWAKGCGTTGKISPFGGNSKMPFKVEWAAKWWTYGVTIEGAGKDHGSAGGTYDVAVKILSDVFKQKPPLRFTYEFFLSGGKKMASSKGIGLNGEELLEILAPELVRFLMLKNPPHRAVEFTPKGTDLIPRLYDEYENYADVYFKNSKDDSDTDKLKVFKYSQIGSVQHPPKVKFSILTQWIQMPNMADEIKKNGLEQWVPYAKIWLDKYAPDDQKFEVQKELPEAVSLLSSEQKKLLSQIAEMLDQKLDAEAFQTRIYELGKELGLNGNQTFQAIYLSLIGKDHGPKAAWLILSLDSKFVKTRFEEASGSNSHPGEATTSTRLAEADSIASPGTGQYLASLQNDKIKLEIFSIDRNISKKFPSASVGIAIIKGVSIKQKDLGLEKEKNELLDSLSDLTTEELGQYPEITSYRKLYKEMGIDWHSKRPSPEALLRRVALKKGLYNINTVVDSYNLIVMKNRVSIGAFNLDKVEFPTVLRFAKEGEKILLLGDSEETDYKPSEVAYFDQKGGFNMDFNYRDAQRTAVNLDTKNLYINVDGIYDVSPEKVEQVLKEACDKIIKYCGGKIDFLGVETT